MLLAELGEPIMSSTLLLPGETVTMTDPAEIKERLDHQVDLVIDGGTGGVEPSSVVDLSSGTPVIVRRGKGDVSAFE
jgi:tRNA A37 threonylcarbamoyladenosine synthetase subunit TsaC/SUA5/YrdC